MAVLATPDAVSPASRSPTHTLPRPLGDIVAGVVLLALAALGVWVAPLLDGGIPRGDPYWQFIPWYTFLGDELRAGNIPGWNPHQFSGAPFAGDPQSGWMYLPAMALFAVLPPVHAYTLFALFHLAFAGGTAYALGRVHGFTMLAALVVGVAYMFSPFVEGVFCCGVRTQVASWLPLAILGVELALRAPSWLGRAGWWSVAGVAISQMLGGWLGQGAYYGLLTIGAYLFFRAVVAPPPLIRALGPRLAALLVHGAAILILGFGLAAAGVLPRVEAVSRSNLAGGVYQGNAGERDIHPGWEILNLVDRVLTEEGDEQDWYLAGAVFVLAVASLLIARRRSLVLFWAVFSVGSAGLTLSPTPAHEALYAVLPRFEVLHQYAPHRSLLTSFLGPALMAGATVDAIARWRRPTPLPLSVMLVGPLLFLMATYLLEDDGRAVGPITFFGVFTVGIVLGLAVLLSEPWLRRLRLTRLATSTLVPVLLALLVFWDPTGGQVLRAVREHGVVIPRVPANLHGHSCFGESTAAATFLQGQQAAGPWRYFGHDGAYLSERRRDPNYRYRLERSEVQRLLVVNQSHCLENLHDAQGYNPVQLARYTEFFEAMNGRTQEYHESNVLPGGLASPLLDVLNARFIVVPVEMPPGRPDLLHLGQRFPTVHTDAQVRVLENPEALPRAWLVHEARQVPAGEALPLMTSGEIDLADVAVLESVPPELAPPDDEAADRVAVRSYAPDAIDLTTRSDAPGLMILSESDDPGWTAAVDGAEVPLVVADHALRAVPVPAGEHTVALRYEPRPLRRGLAITGLTALLMLGIALALALRGLRRGHRREPPRS